LDAISVSGQSFVSRGLCFAQVALLAVAVSSCRGSSAAPMGAGGPPAIPVEIETVRSALQRDTSEYVANLISRHSVRVQPQVDGHVTRIDVASGKRVRAGAPLMQIDPRRQEATVHSQQAATEAAGATLAYWRDQYRRIERLYAGGGASRQELDQARSSLQQAEANTNSSAAQVRAQSVQLRYYEVVAPVAGTVGDIPVRIGDYVAPQTLLTTLDDNQGLEAYVDVPLERAVSLKVGMPVELIDASGKVLAESEVSFVSPRADPDTQTVLMKTRVHNPDGRLRSSQFTRARVVWAAHPGPVVPVLAVQTQNGQQFAWVAKRGPDGSLTAQQRVVQVGPIQGQTYPVIKGVAVGEMIITSGVQKLRPGAPVTQITDGGQPGR
jgi:RND family efflux transporter MFP subunit